MISVCVPKLLSAKSIKELLDYSIEFSYFSLDKLFNCDLLKKLGMKFGIVYHYDYVESDIIDNIDMTLENIIEARFFAEDRELRIFNEEDGVSGTLFKSDSTCEKFEEKYYLFPRSKDERAYPYKLIVNKYIGYDEEDNQAYISYVAPAKLCFRKEKAYET